MTIILWLLLGIGWAMSLVFLVLWLARRKRVPVARSSGETKFKDEEKQIVFQEYELVVKTQMHFNEMLMRYRSLAFTIMTGLAALGLLLLKGEITYKEKVMLFGMECNIAGVLALLILAVWGVVFLVDYFYYFRLLIGAVERGEQIEKSVPAGFLGMTTGISKKMPRPWAHLVVILFYAIPFAAGLIIAIHLLISPGTVSPPVPGG